MSNLIYYLICAVLTVGVLVGIAMMGKVKTAVQGNAISAVCTAAAILLTLYKYNILSRWELWLCAAIGLVIGLWGAYRVQMIEMPQVVALLNGLGGAASALVAIISLLETPMQPFACVAAGLALCVGVVTLSGSLIAAGKLHRLISQRSVLWNAHRTIVTGSLLFALASIAGMLFCTSANALLGMVLLCTTMSLLFGVAFAIRVGGADMPITISLLNSLSGVAGAIAGMAISDPLLVAIGGVVGASGLLLTQVMCHAMNRSLMEILTGIKTPASGKASPAVPATQDVASGLQLCQSDCTQADAAKAIRNAKTVIIIPGYGMALAQAQMQVKQLADQLEQQGKDVSFAIHPVAGRMPGHMNVLLAEVDVPYEKLCELDEINSRFNGCDVAIIIGANDVVNPAANTAEGTPIYGMPILNVDQANAVIICNYDLKPGYAGVPNPLYENARTMLLTGDAKQTLTALLESTKAAAAHRTAIDCQPNQVLSCAVQTLHDAQMVIIIPGYGMALAQAQMQVKQLADRLEGQGKDVSFAIHPVAGRMPGHMNVLLAEADVPYEKLHEMQEINERFDHCDVAIIIGANDVVNPSANTAKGTPIYGMPVLHADKARSVIICNYDRNPGYAGVNNPLYDQENAMLLLGDARETLAQLL